MNIHFFSNSVSFNLHLELTKRLRDATEIQQSIQALKNDLQETDSANLPKVLQETLNVIEEMTNLLQPASSLQT